MSQLRRGTVFIHAHWLDADKLQPLRCEVTAVRQGTVYWRDASSTGKAKDCFTVEQASRYVKEIISSNVK